MPKSAFSNKYQRFRLLLVEARKKRGLTQMEMAEKLGKPQSFVSKFERGERRLDVVEFLDVAEALRLDFCVLLKQLQKSSKLGVSNRRGEEE